MDSDDDYIEEDEVEEKPRLDDSIILSIVIALICPVLLYAMLVVELIIDADRGVVIVHHKRVW